MLTLHVPRDQAFTCQSSGRCCAHWEIPVRPEERDRLLKRDWSPEVPPIGTGKPIVAGHSGEGTLAMNLELASGACPFLRRDKHCAIHALDGGNAKPIACQQFPYKFTPTPEGTFVGLSFSCPSVRNSIGEPLGAQKPAIAAFLSRAGLATEVPEDLTSARLVADQVVPWRSVLEAERELVRLLARHEVPLAMRLTAGDRLVTQMQVARQAGDRLEGRRAVSPEALLEGVRREGLPPVRLKAAEKLAWAGLALNLRSKSEFFWGTHSGVARLAMGVRVLWRWWRLFTGGPWSTADGMERAVRARDARRVSEGLPEAGEDLLTRWVRVKLEGQDFFGPRGTGFSFVAGYRFLMVGVALALFSARARAAAAERLVLENGDLDFGIQTVEDSFLGTAVLKGSLGLYWERALTRRPHLARRYLYYFGQRPGRRLQVPPLSDAPAGSLTVESASVVAAATESA